jgi:hypothetical protein
VVVEAEIFVELSTCYKDGLREVFSRFGHPDRIVGRGIRDAIINQIFKTVDLDKDRSHEREVVYSLNGVEATESKSIGSDITFRTDTKFLAANLANCSLAEICDL